MGRTESLISYPVLTAHFKPPSALIPQQGRERGPHILRHVQRALDRGMDSIGLIESWTSRYTLEEERHQCRPCLARYLTKDVVEAFRVRRSEVRRRLHLRDENAGIRRARTNACHNGADVGCRRVGVQPAQAVVCARFDNHDVGHIGKEPFGPTQRSCRGLAAQARVYNFRGETGGVGFVLQDGRIRFIRIQSQTRCEARPDDQHARTTGCWCR
jgi:hypothetical protein